MKDIPTGIIALLIAFLLVMVFVTIPTILTYNVTHSLILATFINIVLSLALLEMFQFFKFQKETKKTQKESET